MGDEPDGGLFRKWSAAILRAHYSRLEIALNNVVILDFGRTVLRSENDFARAVHEIYRHWRQGKRVIAKTPNSSVLLENALNKVGIRECLLEADPAHHPSAEYIAVDDVSRKDNHRLAPLRVALLGCGTVGGGVYERLLAFPHLFSVTGVGARTGVRARAIGVPDDLITPDLEELIERPCDVVVELIGGTDRATTLIQRSLELGRNVVTANKAVIAVHGDALEKVAEQNATTLSYSAAVGGVLPALETIKRARRAGPIRAFSGVLNGTCNFVLDRLATGESMSAAVRTAQELGFAEARPEIDLNGTDAAQKLILLARAAFDVSLPLGSIVRKGIDHLGPEDLAAAEKRGEAIRLVARCRRSRHGIEASVEPVVLPLDHPLAQVRGAENRLLVEPEDGECIVVSGTGAGRWPTTEAVMADMFDLKHVCVASAAGH